MDAVEKKPCGDERKLPNVPAPSTPSVRKLTHRLALVLLGLMLGMVIAEIGLRLFVEQHSKRLFIYDAQLGWRGEPYGCGVYTLQVDNIRTPFCYNNLGWRDEDVVPRTSSAPRIVMLGDSFVESLEVEYEKTYHKHLERKLQSAVEEGTEVIVIGMAGYGTSQQLLAFRKYKDVADADIVLTMFYTGNDLEDNQRKQYAYLNGGGALHVPDTRPSWWYEQYMQSRRWLYEHSHLVYFVKNSVESLVAVDFSPTTHEVAEEGKHYQEDITKALLLKTRDEVHAAGATYGVVVIPSLPEVREMDYRKIKLVSAWCSQHQVPLLDLSEVVTDEHYLRREGHFNENGHTRVAEVMLRFLQSDFIPHRGRGFAGTSKP